MLLANSDIVRIFIQLNRDVLLLMVNVNITCYINYSYYCGFSCSTGANSRSQTLPVSLGRWGIKLHYSSGNLRAGAPITCPCGPTTVLEWVHRVTQSMSQPKNHVSAFHLDTANVCATLVDSIFNMEPKRITCFPPYLIVRSYLCRTQSLSPVLKH